VYTKTIAIVLFASGSRNRLWQVQQFLVGLTMVNHNACTCTCMSMFSGIFSFSSALSNDVNVSYCF